MNKCDSDILGILASTAPILCSSACRKGRKVTPRPSQCWNLHLEVLPFCQQRVQGICRILVPFMRISCLLSHPFTLMCANDPNKREWLLSALVQDVLDPKLLLVVCLSVLLFDQVKLRLTLCNISSPARQLSTRKEEEGEARGTSKLFYLRFSCALMFSRSNVTLFGPPFISPMICSQVK
eukprot:764364-Hanusia_phi.AAC.2